MSFCQLEYLFFNNKLYKGEISFTINLNTIVKQSIMNCSLSFAIKYPISSIRTDYTSSGMTFSQSGA